MTVAHLSDAELVAALDGAPTSRSELEVEQHLAECGACKERLSGLKARSEALDRWFEIDEDAALPVRLPERRSAASRGRRRSYLLAAGIVFFVGLFGLSPLRGLVVEWLGMAGASTAEAPSAEGLPQPHRFDFEVASGAFELQITGQPRGTLVVRLEGSEGGSIEITGGDGTETVSLGPARAAVDVGPKDGMRIEVALPEDLSTLGVTVAGEEVQPDWRPSATASPRTWTLRLGGT